jgi:phosphomethylpyrimidine synthase
MTQVTNAKKKIYSDIIKEAHEKEPLSKDVFLERIAEGSIVIPRNKNHTFSSVAVGHGTYIKVNANIGISNLKSSLEDEMKKLDIAVKSGAHSIMDLSVCNDLKYLKEIRAQIIKASPVMVGTVPVYEACVKATSSKKDIKSLTTADFLDVIKSQAEDGVDFMTIHAGVTREVIKRLKNVHRVCGIVSRGGSMIAEWIKHNDKENPFFDAYDDILDIAYEYDVTLSLGDGLRPGANVDGTDRPQIQELIILGELVDRARARDVQVMVEGPGHLVLNEIEMNMKLEKKLCRNAPFYVLGPLVTDIAPGYDHITSAIGATFAGYAGADFICYVTPGEHLYLPDIEDVKAGVITSRIAAHAADIALGKKGAKEQDIAMSEARNALDWNKMAEHAIDKDKVTDAIKKYHLSEKDKCTMCGEFCSFKRDY